MVSIKTSFVQKLNQWCEWLILIALIIEPHASWWGEFHEEYEE